MVYEKVYIENGNDKAYIEREGRKVFINFGTTRISVLVGYTLPTQFRPSNTVRLMVAIVNANTNSFTMGRVVITNDGVMKFFTISNYGGQPSEITYGQDWAVYDCISYFK